MKYAAFDESGNIVGFYDDGINKSIPTNSIEITEEQWLECVQYYGKYKVLDKKLVIS